jgi:glycosyltransferase involved in cell wall biosynthesis
MPSILRAALDEVRHAPHVVDVLRDAERLALAAAADGGPDAVRLLAGAVEGDDELTSVAAVHALAAVFDDAADAVLSELLSHPRPFLREHASWALMARLPRLDAIGRLVAVVVAGGFCGMLAQRTLGQWSGAAGDHVALALEGALADRHEPAVRARLVETIGLMPGAVAERAIRAVATNDGEDPAVRVAAVAALGDRAGGRATADVVATLARAGGELGAVARLAAYDLGLIGAGGGDRSSGLTVAQLFLHADIDRGLSRAGAGDNGGIATLLVRLGDALAAEPGTRLALTMSRGTPEAAFDALTPATGHRLARVPLLRPAGGSADAWPAWVAARRGIRRLLRAHRVDVLHLRMAEVGSLAAGEAAADLGVPVVFTLAPDPHAAIAALDRTGGLRRDNFGRVDEREHYWFRARLVQRLAAEAAHVALFPRRRVREDMRELLGYDLARHPGRWTVVPEGIDVAVAEQAAAEVAAVAAAEPATPAVRDLDDLLAGLPGHRRGLPLALSVGRLHRVKGMATLVEAWAGDPDLRERCNLLIVGGDLADPSPDEREQLDLIAGVLARHPGAADGLLLAGHRPNDVVARWLAVAHAGRPPLAGPDGVYVCASLKEEFGLALLEALAAGLVVVGPDAGGPATYIEDGVTGLLADTSRPAEVARAVRAALDLATGPAQGARVQRAQRLIRDGFTVRSMASALAGVYAAVTEPAGRS